METKNLQQNAENLYLHMKQLGYSDNTIQRIRSIVNLILKNPEKWTSYDDMIEYFYNAIGDNYESFRHKRHEIQIVKDFDLSGVLPRDPDNQKSSSRFMKGTYLQLNPEYKGLIDYYYGVSINADYKKESTIYNECCNASSFLLKLQCIGIVSLKMVNEESILPLLVGDDGYPAKSASYADRIRSVFVGSSGYNPECRRIATIIPKMRKRRKTIQYLTKEENIRIKSTLAGDSDLLNLRDRAIFSLLYYYGLRASDISNLKLVDLDWERDEISIVQQKTDVMIMLPLTATVGNAIYEYITKERILSDCEYVFLSSQYPFGKLSPKAIERSTGKLFKASNIRPNRSDRKGTHIFRHNFATSMLENGVPVAVISRTLGHTSPESTETYISADMVHMKDCSLSIEDFPLDEEVFNDGDL